MKNIIIGLAATLIIITFIVVSDKPSPDGRIWIGGGPQGGALILFAEGLKELLEEEVEQIDANVIGSGGSVANFRSIEAGKLDLAWGYAADAYLGYKGTLVPGLPPFKNTLILGRVYGSSAQLVVNRDSVIHTPFDLINRRVAVGCSGSGSAHSAQRYFGSLGIWDKIIPLYMGYDLGIREMNRGRAEAVWQLAGVPSPSISELSEDHPVRLIDLLEDARKHNFFDDFPFYTESTIAAGTYDGMETSISTYQDNTLLVTHAEVDPELVKLTMSVLFSHQGITTLRDKHQIAHDLDLSKGLQGIKTPLHPEAEQFWKEKGLIRQ